MDAILGFRGVSLSRTATAGRRRHPPDRAGRAVARLQFDQQHRPAPALHQVGADHLVDAVVGALHQHVGPQRLDQLERRVLVEQHHQIHRCQRRHHRRPRRLVLQRPCRSLQPLHRGVGVQGDDQPVAACPCLGQQPDMAGVDQVEAAIGEADPQSLRPPRRRALRGLVARRDLAVGRHQVRQMQHAEQFLAADRRGARLAHGNAGGDVGEHRRLRQRGARRPVPPRARPPACRRRRRHRRPRAPASAGAARARRAAPASGPWPTASPAPPRSRLSSSARRPARSAPVSSAGIDPGGLPHLELVRRQHRGAAVGGEFAALRVGDHRASGCPGLRQRALATRRRSARPSHSRTARPRPTSRSASANCRSTRAAVGSSIGAVVSSSSRSNWW